MNKFVVFIIVIVLIGGGFWYWQKNQTAVSPSPSVAGTKTYQNSEHAFQLQYPATWEVKSQDSVLWFASPETKSYLVENAKYCAYEKDTNQCNPEALPGDIQLSFVSHLNAPELQAQNIKHELIYSYQVSEYTLQNVYDDYHFEFQNNGVTYNFSTSLTEDFPIIKQMISTLKPTK